MPFNDARQAPDLSVVIVTYRCREQALECLASLYGRAGAKSVRFETIVLDNDSGDGTADVVSEQFPDVRLIALGENLGFARGVNRAVERAAGEFVLLLNPDTIVHEGALDRLVAFARAHPRHGIYGGRTLDPDGRVNPGSCWGKPSLMSLACFALMLSSVFKGSRVFDPESLGPWQRDSVREVDVVTGCLMLVPRVVWNELGGFDPRFFMYGEDADLNMRAADAGYRPIITPDAVITHEIGASSSTRADKVILLFKSKATLVRKHQGRFGRPLGLAFLWAGVGLRALGTSVGTMRGDGMFWSDVWRTRGDWLPGYKPNPDGSGTPG